MRSSRPRPHQQDLVFDTNPKLLRRGKSWMQLNDGKLKPRGKEQEMVKEKEILDYDNVALVLSWL